MKYGWSRSISHGIHEESKKYHVTLWRQPWHRWLIARVYHWYDMRIFKVPGFKLLENWLDDDDWRHLPLSAKQDIRCYDLSEKQREILAVLQVTEEQYTAIGKGRPNV